MRHVLTADDDIYSVLAIFERLGVYLRNRYLHICKSDRDACKDTNSVLGDYLYHSLVKRGLRALGNIPLCAHPTGKIILVSARLNNVRAIRLVHRNTESTSDESHDSVSGKRITALGKLNLTACLTVDNDTARITHSLVNLGELNSRELLVGRRCRRVLCLKLFNLVLDFRQEALKRDSAKSKGVVEIVSSLNADLFRYISNNFGNFRIGERP